MEEELNTIIGKYGIVTVHMYLEQRIKHEYNYLKKFFEKKVVEQKVVDNKIVDNKTIEKAEVVEPPPTNEVIEEATEKNFKDPKEMKKWQKEMEEKKRIEQEAKGVNPKDLLTKENLQKWYGEEGRTFCYISREYIGCKDTDVSNAVKTFGIVNTRKNLIVRGLLQKKK